MGFLPVMDDGQFGLALIQQRQGVHDEAGNNVQLHLGPQVPIRIHRGHQPVETVVALDRDPQGARVALGQARHIPACLGHLG